MRAIRDQAWYIYYSLPINLTNCFPDREVPDWPKLLHLYSRLKPGVTVYEWMQEFDVEALGIDVRRFTSFGVVKVWLTSSP